MISCSWRLIKRAKLRLWDPKWTQSNFQPSLIEIQVFDVSTLQFHSLLADWDAVISMLNQIMCNTMFLISSPLLKISSFDIIKFNGRGKTFWIMRSFQVAPGNQNFQKVRYFVDVINLKLFGLIYRQHQRFLFVFPLLIFFSWFFHSLQAHHIWSCSTTVTEHFSRALRAGNGFCKLSKYAKLHSHWRLVAARIDILPFFSMALVSLSNGERKKAKYRFSQLKIALVNAAKYKLQTGQRVYKNKRWIICILKYCEM